MRAQNYGKTRLPKSVMPSFCERSEAKAGPLHGQALCGRAD